MFCFFRAINDIDSRMAAYSLADANMAPEEGNGIYGDYAVCCGPQSYCTGGVWILAAPSTDNLLLDREICSTRSRRMRRFSPILFPE